MRKWAWFSLALLILSAFPPEAAANTLWTTLIPADARWVIHIDVARLAETRIKALLYEDSGGGIGRAVKEMEAAGKINLLRDMSGVTIIGLGPEEKDTVVVFEGKVDREYLLSLIKLEKSTREIPYGKFTLYNWGSAEYGVFASDNLTLIGGNARTIQAVLDAWEGKGRAATGSPLLGKLASVSPGAFMVASTNNISALTRDKESSAILRKAGAAVLHLGEEKGIVKIRLVLDTDSAETASNLTKIVDGLIAMQAMGGEKPPRGIDFLKDLKISREGSVIQAILETAVENLSRRPFSFIRLPF